ncbi:MAG: transaldolase, partial [Hyphomicrobiaceae bacterium]|nr:transaldolase [Hyphomicrobiaceae bacterium]
MKATQKLHDTGQSLWIDDITRDMLDSGTLAKYISELSVTGLTSNPTIFDRAVTKSDKYDDEIRRLLKSGLTGEPLFFELALQDLSRAAGLFLPVHQQTATVDGWVSLEVSPLLAYDTDATIAEAKRL